MCRLPVGVAHTHRQRPAKQGVLLLPPRFHRVSRRLHPGADEDSPEDGAGLQHPLRHGETIQDRQGHDVSLPQPGGRDTRHYADLARHSDTDAAVAVPQGTDARVCDHAQRTLLHRQADELHPDAPLAPGDIQRHQHRGAARHGGGRADPRCGDRMHV